MVAKRTCFSRKPAFSHFLSSSLSKGILSISQLWLIRSKQALISPSKIQLGRGPLKIL